MDASILEQHPFLSRGLGATTLHPLGLEVERALGPWLILKDGTELFDAISGIGVSNFGHGHPLILGEIESQMNTHLHTMVYGEFIQSAQTKASELLRSTLPSSLDSIYFVNSGAEAIEAALKLAKRATGRKRILGVAGGYHGNTHGALSVSSNESRKAPFRPLLPEIEFLSWNDISDLNRIDDTIAVVVLETVQGDAGVRIPAQEWMRELRAHCDTSGAMLILDEIQCGMGRTGKPWAFQHFHVIPDAVCMGKALGGGMPIGALATSTHCMAQLAHDPALGHITTFGGHPMSCAGAIGALSVMKSLDFEEINDTFSIWEKTLTKHPLVRHVRRLGAFLAVELGDSHQVQRVVEAGLHREQQGRGVLLFWFLSVPNAFRLAPPLNVSIKESQLGLQLVLRALDAAM